MKIAQILFLILTFYFTINAQTTNWIRVQSDNGEFSAEIPQKYSFFYDKDGFSVSDSGYTSYELKNMYMVNAYTEKTLLSFEVYEANRKAVDNLNEKDMVGGKESEINQNGVKIKQIIKKTNDFFAVSRFWFQEAGMIIPCNEGIAPNV